MSSIFALIGMPRCRQVFIIGQAQEHKVVCDSSLAEFGVINGKGSPCALVRFEPAMHETLK